MPPEGMVTPINPPAGRASDFARQIDPDALKVLTRLRQFNHVAYLVGGSVRDLLLDRRPKDFDIGTSAHPQEVKRMFRNCWIIGRRFRLAHVKFGTKTIEVATFRRLLSEQEIAEHEAAAAEAAQEAAGGRARATRSRPRAPARQHVRHARSRTRSAATSRSTRSSTTSPPSRSSTTPAASRI